MNTVLIDRHTSHLIVIKDSDNQIIFGQQTTFINLLFRTLSCFVPKYLNDLAIILIILSCILCLWISSNLFYPDAQGSFDIGSHQAEPSLHRLWAKPKGLSPARRIRTHKVCVTSLQSQQKVSQKWLVTAGFRRDGTFDELSEGTLSTKRLWSSLSRSKSLKARRSAKKMRRNVRLI